MTTFLTRRHFATFALVAGTLLGCREETSSPNSQGAVSAPGPPALRLVRRLEADVRTLNYIHHTEEGERQVLAYIHDPLVAIDQNLQPAPSLATHWTMSRDGRIFTLHLDPRATFSDGVPLTAADVLFTLNAILDEKSPQFSAAFSDLDRTKTRALDDHSVLLAFKETRAGRLLAFNIGILPKHAYKAVRKREIAEVIGTGAYIVKQHVPGRRRDRAANELLA